MHYGESQPEQPLVHVAASPDTGSDAFSGILCARIVTPKSKHFGTCPSPSPNSTSPCGCFSISNKYLTADIIEQAAIFTNCSRGQSRWVSLYNELLMHYYVLHT